MIRSYDTSALHWKDEVLRIRHLEAEIADMQKDIDRIRRPLPLGNAFRGQRSG